MGRDSPTIYHAATEEQGYFFSYSYSEYKFTLCRAVQGVVSMPVMPAGSIISCMNLVTSEPEYSMKSSSKHHYGQRPLSNEHCLNNGSVYVIVESSGSQHREAGRPRGPELLQERSAA